MTVNATGRHTLQEKGRTPFFSAFRPFWRTLEILPVQFERVTVTLLFFIASFLASAAVGQDDAGEITQLIEKMAPEREHDFGTVAAGKEAVHQFAIKNPLDRPIVFKSVSSSCGCAAAKMPRREISPGETVQLPVELDTLRFQGDRSASITVQFTEKELPEIQFQCRAVVEIFSVSPEIVNLSGPDKSVEIEVRRVGSSYWKVRSAESTDPRISVELGKKSVESKVVGYKLVCNWDSAEPIPEGQASIRLTTNDSRHHEVDIPVVFKPEVELAPDTIRLQKVGDSCNVVLKTRAPGRILELAFDSKLIEVQENKIDEVWKQVHILKVTRLADSETLEKEAVAEIRFDNSISKKIKVQLK